METLRKDLLYSLRVMRRNKSVTAIVLLTLMVGIGANTAIFSIVYGVLLKPLPYQNSEQLVRVFDHWRNSTEPGDNEADVAPANFFDWQSQAQSFSGIAAFVTGGAGLASASAPEKVNAAIVTPEFFNIMAVKPTYGRVLGQDDLKAPNVIVLGYDLWQRQFGGNPSTVGQTAKLDGEMYTIVGIAPPGFSYPEKTQVWAPLLINTNPTVSRDGHFLKTIARMKPGVSVPQAASEMNTIAARLEQQYQATNKDLGANVVSLHEHAVGKVKKALVILLMAVGFVLLIACANIANLLLARAYSRQKEVSVRIALGASRKRLVRQLLTESLVLAFTGGILGLIFASMAVSFLVSVTVSDIPLAEQVGLSPQVLIFTFVVCVLTGTLFGLIPAMQTTKVDLNETLKEGGGKGVSESGGSRVRGALVVFEVALTLVLLIGAGLMIKSFASLLNTDLGFQTQNVLTFETDLPNQNYPDIPKVASFYDSLVTRLKALPGVQAVGGVTMLPLGGENRIFTFRIEGQPVVDAAQRPVANYRVAMPEYFSALSIPLESGRMFTDADKQGSAPVLIINERMAKRHFPQGNAIGQRIYVRNDPNSREIVGVVKSVRHFGLDQEPQPEMYVPYWQSSSRYMRMVVRTNVAPRTLVNAVQRQVWDLDRELPVGKINSMDELVSKSASQQRSNMVLLTLFAAVALVLAAIGIYGVVSYSVTQRTHEIGIRMALGASRKDIFKLIITRGMTLTAIGIILGIAGAYGLTRAIRSLLFGVGTLDVAIFVMVPVVFAIIALFACFFPARKASRVDPLVALRYE
ncbi:MAG TPA: ABC transporter permease [Pyrinomonadaceae bacterium]|nr:ABC transporter permease [Pyrinomonadaceae bacterium]